MTISEEIFRLDTEIQKLSKTLCASGLIIQHLKHSKAYVPDRYAYFINECESLIRYTESQIHEEIGRRVSELLGSKIVDDEILDAFLPEYKDPDEQVISSD